MVPESRLGVVLNHFRGTLSDLLVAAPSKVVAIDPQEVCWETFLLTCYVGGVGESHFFKEFASGQTLMIFVDPKGKRLLV